MTAMAAPGSTVLRMVGNRMSVLNIEVETGWHPDRIRELAEEEGYSFEAATGRFFRASHVSAGTGEAGDSTDAHEAAAQSPAVPADQTVTGTGGAPSPMPAAPLAPVPVPHVVEVAPVPQPPQVAPAPTATPAAPVVEVEAHTSPPTSTTDINALISAGLACPDPVIGDMAHALVVGASRLAGALIAYEHRGQALAEVERLEQLLKDARTAAGLDIPPSHRHPRPKPRAVGGTATPAVIRAWAAGAGVECPARGIVPRHVVDAYLDAHEDVPA